MLLVDVMCKGHTSRFGAAVVPKQAVATKAFGYPGGPLMNAACGRSRGAGVSFRNAAGSGAAHHDPVDTRDEMRSIIG